MVQTNQPMPSWCPRNAQCHRLLVYFHPLTRDSKPVSLKWELPVDQLRQLNFTLMGMEQTVGWWDGWCFDAFSCFQVWQSTCKVETAQKTWSVTSPFMSGTLKYTPTTGGSCVSGHMCWLGMSCRLSSWLKKAWTTPLRCSRALSESASGGDTILPRTLEEYPVSPRFRLTDYCKELLSHSPPAFAVSALLLMAVDAILLHKAYEKRVKKLC